MERKMKRLIAVRSWILCVALVFSLLASFFGPAQVSHVQAVVAGFSEYFIPGSTDQLFRILQNIDNDFQLGNAFGVGTCTTGTVPAGGVGGCNFMHNIITVSITTDGTTVYYDHWENGYGNASTGNDEVYTANKGDVLVFESSNITVPRTAAGTCVSTNPNGASTACYDGRDRIYVAGGAVSVAEAFWPEVMGTVFANAWEVYPVKPYQTSYTIPVGEDLSTALGYTDFTNVYVIVMAAVNGTNVQIDNPATPGVEVNVTLNKGDVTELFHINSRTTVTSSNPMQVQFIVGQFNAGLSSDSRSYTAVPDGLWDTAYYSSVPSGPVGLNGYGPANADIYVYNPGASALTVNYQDGTGSGSFSVPAASTRRYSTLTGHFTPLNSGVYLAAADGTSKFWAIGSYDAQSPNYNFGFTLIPSNILTDEYYIGWAPGSTDLSVNGSPVYVTPVQDNTTIFVDYSPTDGIVDATFVLNRVEVLKLLDPDNNNTGMHVWATGPIAMSWGEDSTVSTDAYPYIDAGYTILPLNANWMDVVLSLDKTADPVAIPAEIGQVVTFTLVVNSNAALNPANVIDDLPSGWAYVPLSTTITRPGGIVVTGAPAEPTLSGQRIMWNDVSPGGLVPGQPLTVAFQAVTTAIPTLGYIINDAAVTGTLGTETFTATSRATVRISDLDLQKISSAGGTTSPGSTITYAITTTNNGEVAQNNLVVTDPLPVGTTYVPGSTQVIAPSLQGSAGDAFNAIAYNGNQDSNGATPPSWVGDWVEVGEADGANAGDIQVMTDLSNFQLRIQNANRGALRDVDLSGCTTAYLNLTFRKGAVNAASDFVRLSIGAGGTITNSLFDFAGPTTDATYQSYSVNITNWISAQTRIQLLSSATLAAAENIFFDDIRVDCYTSATNPGGAPPNLMVATDSYDLLSGQSMTITYQVVVDNPVPAGQTDVVNVVQVTSDEQIDPLKSTTTDKLPGIFDPPFGLKVFDDSGFPLLQWTMVWINNANSVPINAFVSDPISAGTTYVASGASSGLPVPAGAPAGSTNVGVSCQRDPSSVSTTTTSCYYEGPTVAFPLGRIIWEGVLGPDLGATNAATAQNEIAIVFNVSIDSGVTRVQNLATIDSDRNGDNDTLDPGEQNVARASAVWTGAGVNPVAASKPLLIPVTGFAPHRVSLLPEQPSHLSYATYTDLTLSIPALGVTTMPIVGVPYVDGNWDVSWLGNSAGYLAGTAFPTWQGNSVITAHVYDSNGLPGPFVNLGTLKWGDKVRVEAYGLVYTYEVRAVYTVKPYDQRPFGHKDEAWVTLITCKQYDEKTDAYKLRTVVQAVLVSVDSQGR
jgi:LPXTG-site transpeptidase (sortase) family protein